MSHALKTLTPYYLANPLFHHVYSYIAKASIMQGMILYRRDNQNYLFLKDGDVHVPFDWQLYSLMRASSKLFINSGECIRQEKGVYLTRQSYGDPHVEDLYQSFLDKQRQKLMIVSRKMQEKEILPMLNQQLYELVTTPKFTSLPNLLEQVVKSGQSPVLLQYGLNAMSSYFKAVEKGEPNYLDTLILSYFEGPFLPKYIGDKFQIPLDKYYTKAWASTKLPCKMHNDMRGDLTIEVFTKKT